MYLIQVALQMVCILYLQTYQVLTRLFLFYSTAFYMGKMHAVVIQQVSEVPMVLKYAIPHVKPLNYFFSPYLS